MEFQAEVHIWAAIIGAASIFLALWTLYISTDLKKYYTGNIQKAVRYNALALSSILLIVLFYYASGLYFEANGLRYPSWASELVVSTFSAINILMAYLAAKALRNKVESDTKSASEQISSQIYEDMAKPRT